MLIMDIQWSPALVVMNIAYVLTLAGLAVRNILLLRLLMVSAQLILITTGAILGNAVVVFWNSIFLIINLFQVIVLFREKKPVRIPENLQDIYKKSFFHMSEREFLRFWAIGSDTELPAGYIVKDGEWNNSVFMIIDGLALVRNQKTIVAKLGRGDFIGEMSYISGRRPSADVYADDSISLRDWERLDLNLLKEKNYNLWVKMQQALGHDLVTKVNKMTDKNPGKKSGLLEKAARFTDGQDILL